MKRNDLVLYALMLVGLAAVVLLAVFIILSYSDQSQARGSESESSPHSLATYWMVHRDSHSHPVSRSRPPARLGPTWSTTAPKPHRVPTPFRTVNPPGGPDWDAVAQCESGGHWNHPSTAKYTGGLQMDLTFWHSYHGDRYAPMPWQATKAQQIAVAMHAYRVRGLSPWPYCGRFG